MRNLGFILGFATGFLILTEDGKNISKKFLGSLDKATNEIISHLKENNKEEK